MVNEDFIFDFISIIDSKSIGIDKGLIKESLRELFLSYSVLKKQNPEEFLSNNSSLIKLYFASMKLNGLSDKTIRNYRYHFDRFLKFVNKPLLKVSTDDIRLFLTDLVDKKHIKNSTLETEKSILKSLFSWLEVEEYILKSPAKRIKPTKVEKRLRKSMPLEDIELMRCSCVTSRERCVLELLFSTGVRLEELHKINIDDLNWQDNSIKVIGKGNKERVVYFSSKSKLYIKKYLEDRPISNSNALFITSKQPRNRLGNRSVQIELKNISSRAGIEYSVFPHLLRHSFATVGLNAGMSINVIHDLLGHERLDTTMIYAKTDTETAKYEYRKHLNQ